MSALFAARRIRIALSGSTRIAYQVVASPWARGRPWVVMIQGLGMDRGGWEPVVRLLRRRFRLVLLDNRGIGASDVPPGRYTVADMAGDVLAVLDAAGVPRAHVVGASLGGMIAQEFALRFPERVGRLVLVCTSPGWPVAYPMPASTARLWSSRRLPPEVLARRHIENALAPDTVRTRPDLVDELVERQLALSPDVEGWRAQAGAGARYAGYGRQHRIRARTLVVHGAADSVVDPRNARLLARGIPDAQLVTFSEAGHLLFWEQPERFAAVVGDFLGDGPPAGVAQLLSRGASTLSSLNQSVRAARQGARIAG